MQQKLKLSIGDWSGIIILLIMLVCIRVFENKLFYDPFLLYFKGIGKDGLPDYNTLLLFVNYTFRYFLNTLFSLGILWLVFKSREIIKLTSILYAVFFAIIALILLVVLLLDSPMPKLIFYLRRFLIQPLLLLLFIPAFYYQKYLKK